ncbi:secretion activator protein [Deinococcus psychrotolerans]|uniref:Secretion activator protein n=1 Tax=Deinococcus psychrotolerans TaxID=2489213 RepID=A0A3G8YLA8_9DEIO|nr:glycosyl hydrolase 108 family protein [Deinococcus psychrotolerans]AZI41876.1 secretion activator protein [Deinococcus psychrotolerans]
MNGFNEAFEIVIGHEGGLSLDPRDRGNWSDGAFGQKGGILKGTKYGVAAHAYPTLDIRNLTLADARAIYKQNYWDRAACDHLPAPLALVVFDTAINSGVSRALGFLAQTKDWRRYLDLRLQFLQSLSSWKTFGRGWTRRVDTLRTQAQQWQDAAATPITRPSAPAPPVLYLYSQNRDPNGTLRPDWTSIAVDAEGRVLLGADKRPRTVYMPPELAAAKGLK